MRIFVGRQERGHLGCLRPLCGSLLATMDHFSFSLVSQTTDDGQEVQWIT